MLDRKFIFENVELVKKNCRDRGVEVDVEDVFIARSEEDEDFVEGLLEAVGAGGDGGGGDFFLRNNGELAGGGVVDGHGEVGGGDVGAGLDGVEDLPGAREFAVAAGVNEGVNGVALDEVEREMGGEAGALAHATRDHHGDEGRGRGRGRVGEFFRAGRPCFPVFGGLKPGAEREEIGEREGEGVAFLGCALERDGRH